MTDDGDCFIKNGQVFIDSDIYDFLCHGTAIGRGEIKGIKHKHCWIEKGDVVFDFSNGNEIIIRKEAYYGIGKITKVKRYTKEEAIKKMLNSKHWGSWE